MKAINITNFRLRGLAAAFLMSVALSLFGSTMQVFAHGGEDHGDAKPAALRTNGAAEVRSVRIKDFEVTLKNAPLAPDTESSARLFVTKFATNEPVPNARITLTIEREGDQTEDIAATATDMPGSFVVKLPPIPEGAARLRVRLESADNVDNASLGEVKIAPQVETSAAETSWAQTALYWLLALLAMALVGAIGWFSVRRWQLTQNAQDDEIQQEVVSV